MYYPIYINPLNGEVNEIENNIFSIETLPKRPTGEESRWTWGPDKFLIDKSKLIGKKVNRKGEPDFWDIFRIDYLEKNDGENKKTKTPPQNNRRRNPLRHSRQLVLGEVGRYY